MFNLRVLLEPKGFRDLYWCQKKNEPFFPGPLRAEPRGTGEPGCPFCHVSLPEEEHRFMFHVYKPGQGQNDLAGITLPPHGKEQATPDPKKVICPNCVWQFPAVPEVAQESYRRCLSKLVTTEKVAVAAIALLQHATLEVPVIREFLHRPHPDVRQFAQVAASYVGEADGELDVALTRIFNPGWLQMSILREGEDEFPRRIVEIVECSGCGTAMDPKDAATCGECLEGQGWTRPGNSLQDLAKIAVGLVDEAAVMVPKDHDLYRRMIEVLERKDAKPFVWGEVAHEAPEPPLDPRLQEAVDLLDRVAALTLGDFLRIGESLRNALLDFLARPDVEPLTKGAEEERSYLAGEAPIPTTPKPVEVSTVVVGDNSRIIRETYKEFYGEVSRKSERLVIESPQLDRLADVAQAARIILSGREGGSLLHVPRMHPDRILELQRHLADRPNGQWVILPDNMGPADTQEVARYVETLASCPGLRRISFNIPSDLTKAQEDRVREHVSRLLQGWEVVPPGTVSEILRGLPDGPEDPDRSPEEVLERIRTEVESLRTQTGMVSDLEMILKGIRSDLDDFLLRVVPSPPEGPVISDREPSSQKVLRAILNWCEWIVREYREAEKVLDLRTSSFGEGSLASRLDEALDFRSRSSSSSREKVLSEEHQRMTNVLETIELLSRTVLGSGRRT